MDINLQSGLFDQNTPADIRWMFSCVAKMSFDCLETGDYIFTDDIMQHHLDQHNVQRAYLSKLGPVDVFDGGNNGMTFIHKLFQEYSAAHHVADDKYAFNQILTMWHEKSPMFEKFRKSIIFAVGINPKLLDDFPMEGYTICLLASREGEYRLDLSFESELINECTDPSIAKRFLSRVVEAPIDPTCIIVDALPDINLKAYKELLKYLTHCGCLTLLKRAFPSNIDHATGHNREYGTTASSSVDSARESMQIATEVPLIQPQHESDDLIVGDPIILAALVSVNLGRTRRLTLKNIKPSTLSYLIADQVGKTFLYITCLDCYLSLQLIGASVDF